MSSVRPLLDAAGRRPGVLAGDHTRVQAAYLLGGPSAMLEPLTWMVQIAAALTAFCRRPPAVGHAER